MKKHTKFFTKRLFGPLNPGKYFILVSSLLFVAFFSIAAIRGNLGFSRSFAYECYPSLSECQAACGSQCAWSNNAQCYGVPNGTTCSGGGGGGSNTCGTKVAANGGAPSDGRCDQSGSCPANYPVNLGTSQNPDGSQECNPCCMKSLGTTPTPPPGSSVTPTPPPGPNLPPTIEYFNSTAYLVDQKGSPVTLSWKASQPVGQATVLTCQASSQPLDSEWNGSVSISGSKNVTTDAKAPDINYTLTCRNNKGSDVETIDIHVGGLRASLEFEPDIPYFLGYWVRLPEGSTFLFKLTWRATEVTSCVATTDDQWYLRWWNGSKAFSGEQVVQADRGGSPTFVLTCKAMHGYPTIVKKVTVHIITY